ncbi:MAG: SufE family protein [Bacteroidia bacterium]
MKTNNMESTKSIAEIQDEIVEEFEMLGDDIQEKQWHIINIGEDNPGLPATQQTDENRIFGCQSLVWVVPEFNADGTISFKGDSNSPFVKGLVTLITRIFSGHKPAEIIKADLGFMERIGLEAHTSFFRRNGMEALVKKIKEIANSVISNQ